MDKRLDGLMAANPKAAKSGDKIRAALALVKRLRDKGLSSEGYRLGSPASTKKVLVVSPNSNFSRARLKLTNNA